jgi:hypothetical protein
MTPLSFYELLKGIYHMSFSLVLFLELRVAKWDQVLDTPDPALSTSGLLGRRQGTGVLWL